jgi:hypothetical protein
LKELGDEGVGKLDAELGEVLFRRCLEKEKRDFKSILRLLDTCINKILCRMKISGISQNTRPGIVLSFFFNFDHN